MFYVIYRTPSQNRLLSVLGKFKSLKEAEKIKNVLKKGHSEVKIAWELEDKQDEQEEKKEQVKTGKKVILYKLDFTLSNELYKFESWVNSSHTRFLCKFKKWYPDRGWSPLYYELTRSKEKAFEEGWKSINEATKRKLQFTGDKVTDYLIALSNKGDS